VKLRLIVVGRDRNEPLVEAAEGYRARLQHYFSTELVELKETPLKNASVEQVKKEEAAKIREALQPGERWIVLDERGKEQTTMELAERLRRAQDEGQKSLTLVIGGPSGLDPQLIKEAHERWALSKLTLPHRMARLLLCEQLYRAGTILRGEPYHK
jgi:23S rRNA (pseudouridine1915-N3)-methyltransferase